MNNIILLAGILSLILGVVVFIRSKNQVQRTFSYLIFIITIWDFTNYYYNLNPSYPFVNLSYSTGAILITVIFFWVANYCNINLKRITKLIVIFFGIVLTIGSLIPELFIKQEISLSAYGFNVEPTSFFIFYALPASLILFATILMLSIKLKNSTGLQRLQLTYVILGFTIPIVLVVIIDFILPFFGIYSLASLDATTSLIFAGFISYAILKYRFMDIKVVVKKGLLHFTSVVILFFIYFYLLFDLKNRLNKSMGWSEQTALIVVILVIVLTIEPLRKLILKVIDKIFYSEDKKTKQQTEKLELTLNSTTQFDKLINTIENSLKSYLTTSSVNFIWLNKQTGKLESYKGNQNIVLESTGPVFQYLKSNPKVIVTEEIPYIIEEMSNGEKELLQKVEKKLKSLKVAMVLPIGEPGELVGAFLFDKKRKNNAFTSEDIDYITNLQPQMTGAIANAVFYKQAVDRITQE